VGMPFGYPRISIPVPANQGGGPAQGFEDDLETKKEKSNTYSTRTLVNHSLVEYIKPGKGAPRETTYNIEHRELEHTR
jgi:hypothetical protein